MGRPSSRSESSASRTTPSSSSTSGACRTRRVELRCASADEVASAIRELAVRGAPAIGVAAAYDYALAASRRRTPRGGVPGARHVAAHRGQPPLGARRDARRSRPRAPRDPQAEVERCRRMAAHATGLFAPGSTVLTHCNTGGLATGGYGTALGAIRAAWERGLVQHVLVDETRPLLRERGSPRGSSARSASPSRSSRTGPPPR